MIGPTLTNELIASNCQVEGLGWNPKTGECWFSGNWTDAQKQAVQAVLAAHDPTKQLPNATGFIAALKATVFPDPIRRNTVMRAYTEMMPAIQMGDWPTVSALVQDSISATPTGLAITSAEHAALQAAWTANALPGTCP